MSKNVTVVDEHQLLASICRESFREFVAAFWEDVPGAGKMIHNWHLDVFCEEAQAVAERVITGKAKEYDLVVNVSPGTSKSTIFSILLPAWVWTRMPSCRILTASHTDALVTDLAAKARTVIKCEKYAKCFPNIILREDQDSKGYYANTLGGDRFTCTVGGKTPMGFHAHIIIGDDLTDPKKILSEAEIQTAREFVDNVLPTRKVDRSIAVTLLVMQRLGVEDPTSVMLESAKREGASPVRHVCLPAELEVGNDGAFLEGDVKPTTLAKNYINGLMDPHRLGRKVLDEYKARGNHFYSTQFLQKPYSKTGGMFHEKYFLQRVKAAPYQSRRVRYWDRAASNPSAGAARTAGVLMCESTDNNLRKYFIEHVVVGQWAPHERNQIMKSTAMRDRAKYGPAHEPVIWIEREGGASGKESFQYLAQYLSGFSIFEHDVAREGSKETRAEPWSSQLAAGNVYVVDNGGFPDWDIDGYVKEHCSFPLGKWKDLVDASSGGFNRLALGKQPAGQMRVIKIGDRSKDPKLRIVVCAPEHIAQLQFDQQYLLVQITNPEPLRKLVIPGADANMRGQLALEFVDLIPEHYQEMWNAKIEPYGKTPQDLIFNQDHGKKLWSFLLKKREPAVWVYVIQDEGGDDDRAMTLAYGIADGLRVKREDSIWNMGSDEFQATNEDLCTNANLYDLVKSTRHFVMG